MSQHRLTGKKVRHANRVEDPVSHEVITMSRTDDSGKDEEAFLGQASEPVSGMLSLLGDVDKLIKQYKPHKTMKN